MSEHIGSEFEIQYVQFYEISARVDEKSADHASDADRSRDDPGDNLAVELGIRDESNRFGFRLTADYADNRVIARIDCAIFFSKPDGRADSYTANDLAAFGAEHGIPILVPYLREALAEITRRITGKAAVLGLVKVGDIELPENF